MKSFVLAITSAVLLGLVQSPALAALVNFGTAEGVTARDCIAGEWTQCDSLSKPSIFVYGGTPGGASSTASFDNPDYGSAFGSVSLSGVVGAPVLRTKAASKSGKRVNTNSVALQRYVYSGSEQVERTFGGVLTYRQYLTEEATVDNGVYALLYIFKTATDVVDVGDTSASNFDALLGFLKWAFENDSGFKELGWDEFFDSRLDVPDGLEELSVTVTLNPGDAIWVYALLQTPAANGSLVDASNTLVTAWDDPESLVPAAQVPEPSTIGLLAWGLLGFGLTAAASRRRATSS